EMSRRKAGMDTMRTVTAAMLTEEERLLAAREATVEKTTLIAQWLGIAVALLFGGVVALASRRRLAPPHLHCRLALQRRRESEGRERNGRQVAEALAADIMEQSRELERRFTEMRTERDRALREAARRGG